MDVAVFGNKLHIVGVDGVLYTHHNNILQPSPFNITNKITYMSTSNNGNIIEFTLDSGKIQTYRIQSNGSIQLFQERSITDHLTYNYGHNGNIVYAVDQWSGNAQQMGVRSSPVFNNVTIINSLSNGRVITVDKKQASFIEDVTIINDQPYYRLKGMCVDPQKGLPSFVL